MADTDRHIIYPEGVSLSDEEKVTYRHLTEHLDILSHASRYDTQKNWSLLHRRIHRTSAVHRTWNIIRLVAVVLLLPLVGWIVYLQMEHHHEVSATVQTTSVSGVVSKIILPDSSVVWLNSSSSLTYPQHFSSGSRKVELQGEAFFKVKSDRQRRFVVLTPTHVSVSAYGTEFNVKAYDDDRYVEASLNKGHIEVMSPNGYKANLKVGQLAKFDKNTHTLFVVGCDLYEKSAWKNGLLVFRRANIEEITKVLGRHYRVKFKIVGDKVSDYVFSATFSNENIEEVLSILKQSSSLRYEIHSFEQQNDWSYPSKEVVIYLK